MTAKRLVFLVLLLGLGAGGYYFRNDLSAFTGQSATADAGGKSESGKGAGKAGKGGAGKGGAGKGGGGAVPVTAALVEQRSMPVKLEAIGNVDSYAPLSNCCGVAGWALSPIMPS